MRSLLAIAVLAALLGGCALKEAPTRPELLEQAFPASIDIPPAWRAGQQPDAVPGNWLALFNDPALAAVIAELKATAVAAVSARAGRVSASISTPDAEDLLSKTWQETIRIL